MSILTSVVSTISYGNVSITRGHTSTHARQPSGNTPHPNSKTLAHSHNDSPTQANKKKLYLTRAEVSPSNVMNGGSFKGSNKKG